MVGLVKVYGAQIAGWLVLLAIFLVGLSGCDHSRADRGDVKGAEHRIEKQLDRIEKRLDHYELR